MQLIVVFGLLTYMVLVLTNIASSKCGCNSIKNETLCASVSVCSYTNGTCQYKNTTTAIKNNNSEINHGCGLISSQDQCQQNPGCAYYNYKCQKFLPYLGCSAYTSYCNNINQYCTGMGSARCQIRSACSQYGSDFCNLLAPFQGFVGSCYLNNQSQCVQKSCSEIKDGNCYLNQLCYQSNHICYDQLPLCSQYSINCDNQIGLDGFCSWNSLNTSCQSIYCTTNFTLDYTNTYGWLNTSSTRCNFKESCTSYILDPDQDCTKYWDTQGNQCQRSNGSSPCESSNSTKGRTTSNNYGSQFKQLDSIISRCAQLTTQNACISYNDCIWITNQCYTFTKCEDLTFRTHDACQFGSAQCTSNNSTCVAFDYCNTYPKVENKISGEIYPMIGIDGPCGIAYIQNDLVWYYGAALGDCSQSQGADHFSCSQLSSNCISNGDNGCINKQNSCSAYRNASTCYIAATLQQLCYFEFVCRNAVCGDKKSADSCWGFQPYIDSPTCFFANSQCHPKLDQCISYKTNTTCIVSNNGPCYWGTSGCVPATKCYDITLQNICESQNCKYSDGKCQEINCTEYANTTKTCASFQALNQIIYCGKLADNCQPTEPSRDRCVSSTNGEFTYASEGVCSRCNPQDTEQLVKIMFNSRPLSQKARDVIKQYYDNL